MDINGRFVARVVMGAAGLGLLALVAVSYDSNRVTLRGVLAAVAVFVVGAIAALWLWRHPSTGGRS